MHNRKGEENCDDTDHVLMRKWLIKQINNCSIPGLSWKDQDKTTFKVPWIHGSRHGWNNADAELFRRWAKHTGKYVEKHDKDDPKKWKANFRCAINSLPDVREIKSMSQKKGPQAYRVYRLLPEVAHRSRHRRFTGQHTGKGNRRKSHKQSSQNQSNQNQSNQKQSNQKQSSQKQTKERLAAENFTETEEYSKPHWGSPPCTPMSYEDVSRSPASQPMTPDSQYPGNDDHEMPFQELEYIPLNSPALVTECTNEDSEDSMEKTVWNIITLVDSWERETYTTLEPYHQVVANLHAEGDARNSGMTRG